ncbi:MAG: ATP cone domain-containing protein [Candidatus Paceibacterota bacterium]|jgi:transcriptional regulator NrdR family protein
MSKLVIKSDGTKTPFDLKKVVRAITRAANDAKLAPAEINKIVAEVSDTVLQFSESKDKIMSSEIRDLILTELDNMAPKVSAEWRRFMNSR